MLQSSRRIELGSEELVRGLEIDRPAWAGRDIPGSVTWGGGPRPGGRRGRGSVASPSRPRDQKRGGARPEGGVGAIPVPTIYGITGRDIE